MPIIDKLKALLSILPYEAETFDKHIYEDLKTAFPEAMGKSRTFAKNSYGAY